MLNPRLRKIHFVMSGWVTALILISAQSVSAQPQTFAILDYWNATPGASWHFVFDGQPQTSTAPDDFTYMILAGTESVAAPVPANIYQTVADDPTDARHLDEDYFVADPGSGNLYYFGTQFTLEDAEVPIPAGTKIILDDPIMLGGPNETIGGQRVDTGSAVVQLPVPGLGTQNVNVNFSATINYLEILPIFDTGAGPFTNVLHSSLNMTISASFNTGPPFNQTIPVIDNFSFPIGELWTNECGILAQDQTADPDDAMSQWIDMILVPGKDISLPPVIDYMVTFMPVMQRGGAGKAFSQGAVRVNTVENTLTYDITLLGESMTTTTTSYIYGNSIDPNAGAGSPLHELQINGNELKGVWNFDESNQFGILAGMTYFQINTQDAPDGFSRAQINGGMIPENSVKRWEIYE